MARLKPVDRRHFTAAARAAAIEARRRKREASTPLDAPGVFVTRSSSSPTRYAWEIRRFGALVTERCRDAFSSPEEARAAGAAALEHRPIGSGRSDREHDARAVGPGRSSLDRAAPPDR